jgi:hypothetical protein
MSHFDSISTPPEGFTVTATTAQTPVAAMEHVGRRIHAVQFHPEVVHTPHGQAVLEHFLYDVCGCPPTWTMGSVIDTQVELIREQVGDARVICALSGGVDSAVAAALVHKAVGPQLTCVFVDTGLMRLGEGEQVVETFQRHQGIELIHVRAADRYFERLAGVLDPEDKRKAIGELFIRIFEDVRRRHRRRQVPGAGHALPRRHRVGHRQRRQDQEPPQRGRAARGHAVRAGRAAAPAVQGRGAQGRRPSSACPTRSCGASRSPAPAWACASSARSRPTRSRSCSRPMRSCARRSAPPARTRDLAGVRRAARHPLGGCDGRRAHLRVPGHHPGRHLRGRHDRRLGPAALRPARAHERVGSSTRSTASTGWPTTSRRSRPAPSSGSDPAVGRPVDG